MSWNGKRRANASFFKFKQLILVFTIKKSFRKKEVRTPSSPYIRYVIVTLRRFCSTQDMLSILIHTCIYCSPDMFTTNVVRHE